MPNSTFLQQPSVQLPSSGVESERHAAHNHQLQIQSLLRDAAIHQHAATSDSSFMHGMQCSSLSLSRPQSWSAKNLSSLLSHLHMHWRNGTVVGCCSEGRLVMMVLLKRWWVVWLQEEARRAASARVCRMCTIRVRIATACMLRGRLVCCHIGTVLSSATSTTRGVWKGRAYSAADPVDIAVFIRHRCELFRISYLRSKIFEDFKVVQVHFTRRRK